jgi:hypothetical protein
MRWIVRTRPEIGRVARRRPFARLVGEERSQRVVVVRGALRAK